MKADWEAWNARSLAEEPIVRLILDGTVARVRLDRKATSISLLVVTREDGQKVLLALKNMGGETTEAWRAVSRSGRSRSTRRCLPHRGGASGCGLGPVSGLRSVRIETSSRTAPERLHDEEVTADYTAIDQIVETPRRKKSRPAVGPPSASGGCVISNKFWL